MENHDPSNPNNRSIRTLLVEDDAADGMLLKSMLVRQPHWTLEIEQVDSLGRTLEILSEGGNDRFELVILDLNLPDCSGLETLARVREVTPYLPIIVVSGMDDRSLSRQAVRTGAQDYVIKDELNPQVLLKSIDQTMARASLEEELRQSRRKTMENALLRQNEIIRAEIGGELHDVLSQNLTAMTLVLKRLRGKLAPGALEKPELLDNLSGLLNQAIQDVGRMSHGLYPPELERRGLNQALEELALFTTSIHDVPCTFQGDEVNLLPEQSLHLYRIAQESISNAIKHATPSLISVELINEAKGIRMNIRDDGCGFDPDVAAPGLGRLTMAHRAEALDARLLIQSNTDEGSDKGSLVSCHLKKPPSDHSAPPGM